MSNSRQKRPNTNSGSIGQFLKARSKYFHTSCVAYMMAHKDIGVPPIPYIGPGKTYDVGKNKAKHERRELIRTWTQGN